VSILNALYRYAITTGSTKTDYNIIVYDENHTEVIPIIVIIIIIIIIIILVMCSELLNKDSSKRIISMTPIIIINKSNNIYFMKIKNK